VRTLSRKDRFIVGLMLFFMLMAWTVELHFVWFHKEHVARTEFDPMSRAWAFYSLADRGYYDAITPFELGLETIQVFFTQWLHLWLIYAIFRARPYRYSLQLGVASYVCYSTALYLLAKHLSGYVEMRGVTPFNLAMLYVANLPWLLGNLYVALDAFAAIQRRFAEAA
jgi:hypothetical protein